MTDFENFLNEAQANWSVKFKKTTYSGTKITDNPINVKARSQREAITKAAKEEFNIKAKDALSLDTKEVKRLD